MDATATPRGISLAVGELGARGRPTFYMTSRTAVSVNWIRSLRPSTVFVDVCPRDTHTPHGLSCFPTHPGVFFFSWGGQHDEILQKPARPLPCPYLPTYLPTLLMGN